jgi:uncharacterized protein (DUF433 family)
MFQENLSKRIEINLHHPRLTLKDIQAALEYDAESVHGEEVHLLREIK